jgi:hypothetical protein
MQLTQFRSDERAAEGKILDQKSAQIYEKLFPSLLRSVQAKAMAFVGPQWPYKTVLGMFHTRL